MSYKKSMSLNPFAMTYLRPEVELMYLLRMHRHYCHVWNRRHWTDSEFAWTLSCYYYGLRRCCVGGVFEHNTEQQVRAVLRQAVDDVNSNPHLLPGIRLHFDLEFIPAYDSFAASRAGKYFTLLTIHGGPRNLIRLNSVVKNFLTSLTSDRCCQLTTSLA